LLGLGFVLQQRVARELPAGDALSFRLFLDLIGKPLWLAGIAAMVSGQLLGAAALGAGDVSLIEPLLTTNLLFALIFVRVLFGQRMGLREWGGSSALIVGVMVFLTCARPRESPDVAVTGTGWDAVASVVVVAMIVGPLVLLGSGRGGRVRAAMLAGGAGLLFGLQDGLTRAVVASLGRGVVAVFVSWPVYVLLLAAITGILLMQSAFEAAPLRASLPVITATEPLVGIGYGIGVYGERVRTSPMWVAGEAIGLAVMVLGVVLVARSHTLGAGRDAR
jgi:drug/metabolite transporter (DMT)-like permease